MRISAIHSMTPQSETKSHSFVGGCHVICTQQRVRPPTQTLRSMCPDRLVSIFQFAKNTGFIRLVITNGHKGQIVSEENFGVFNFPKKNDEFFKDFCPSN